MKEAPVDAGWLAATFDYVPGFRLERPCRIYIFGDGKLVTIVKTRASIWVPVDFNNVTILWDHTENTVEPVSNYRGNHVRVGGSGLKTRIEEVFNPCSIPLIHFTRENQDETAPQPRQLGVSLTRAK